jgi:DNA topoisomerase-1
VFDVETARRGEYTYQELVESGLGEYAGHPIEIKKGKFGEYVKWGDNTLSLKTVKPPFTRTKIVEWIESKLETKESDDSGQGPNTNGDKKNKMILLEIDAATSVRNGKYGPYIYHQPPNTTKPEFHSLRGFKGNSESLPDVLKWIDDKIPSIILLTKHKK